MESSDSDDSFVWTSASASSVISDQSEEMQDVVADSIKQYCDGESESGCYYKKKLQRELLDIPTSKDYCAEEVQPGRTKKQSMKQEPDPDCSRENNIKTEPGSDIDLNQKKKKSKHREKGNGSHDDSQGSACDDKYLEMRVKLEDSSTAHRTSKKKKKKHKSELDLNIVFENHSMNSCEARKSKKEKKDIVFNELNQNDRVYRTDQVKLESAADESRQSKKKKSKKRKHSDTPDAEDMIIEEKFTAEETVVETPRRIPASNDLTRGISEATKLKSKQINSYSSKEFISEESSSDESTELHETGKASSLIKNSATYEKSEESDTICNGNGYNMETATYPLPANDSHIATNKASQRSSKLSDRIRFEDENDSVETDQTHPCITEVHSAGTPSSQLRRFLRVSPDLKILVSKPEKGSLITQDDDLWLFECPREIDIKALEGSDVVFGNRCRIKIEGQTYEGRSEAMDARGHAAVLCAGAPPQHAPHIQNFALHGLIHFRKKIPKAHFVEDSVMTNNQTNFIPLPETKRRHPLFGPDYKRAARIPFLVKERLKAVEVDPSPTGTDKKRKKKHIKADLVVSSRAPYPAAPAPEPAGRKRRRADDHEQPPIKTKRKKHDFGSADGWESAKAIEENLFNF